MTRILSALLLLVAFCSGAAARGLPPQNDKLFAYPPVLVEKDGGDYRIIDYDSKRDINGRDVKPERRVQDKYISTGVRREQHDLIAETSVGKVAHIAVGTSRGASIIVVYLHGQGGSRHQGANDFTFGGNFNRIKNLVNDAGGLYLSPDFTDFGKEGVSQVAALLGIYMRASPSAKVFLACGSMGGHLCWGLARKSEIVKQLGGLILMGSLWDPDFKSSLAVKRRVPILFGHGSFDEVFPIQEVEKFYHQVRDALPGYPIRLVRFETGSHGTPIRMTDWRETINWMLTRTPK